MHFKEFKCVENAFYSTAVVTRASRAPRFIERVINKLSIQVFSSVFGGMIILFRSSLYKQFSNTIFQIRQFDALKILFWGMGEGVGLEPYLILNFPKRDIRVYS